MHRYLKSLLLNRSISFGNTHCDCAMRIANSWTRSPAHTECVWASTSPIDGHNINHCILALITITLSELYSYRTSRNRPLLSSFVWLSCLSGCVCLCVNHGGRNHNRYTYKLVILHGDPDISRQTFLRTSRPPRGRGLLPAELHGPCAACLTISSRFDKLRQNWKTWQLRMHCNLRPQWVRLSTLLRLRCHSWHKPRTAEYSSHRR